MPPPREVSRRSAEAANSSSFPQNDGHLLGNDLRLPPVSARDVIVPSGARRTSFHPSWRRRAHEDDLRLSRLRARAGQSRRRDLAGAMKLKVD